MNSRKFSGIVMGFGYAVGFAGGLGACVAAGLPWAAFRIFGLPISLPGVVFSGAAIAGAAIGGLAALRRFPMVSFALGCVGLALALSARGVVGKSVVATLLRIERSLVPANGRLAQVGLPMIEPIAGIGPAASYVGVGVGWAVCGSTVLVGGSALRVGGSYWLRRCGACGYVRRGRPERDLHFCPRCRATLPPLTARACMVCARTLGKGDQYCGFCGTPAGKSVLSSTTRERS